MILKEVYIIVKELEVGYKWVDSNPLATDTEPMLAPRAGPPHRSAQPPENELP